MIALGTHTLQHAMKGSMLINIVTMHVGAGKTIFHATWIPMGSQPLEGLAGERVEIGPATALVTRQATEVDIFQIGPGEWLPGRSRTTLELLLLED